MCALVLVVSASDGNVCLLWCMPKEGGAHQIKLTIVNIVNNTPMTDWQVTSITQTGSLENQL